MQHTYGMARTLPAGVPPTLRSRLEVARLETLALMRALDQLHLADHLADHPTLNTMYELDADCGEALQVLLQPAASSINWKAMVRDTEASLRRLPPARDRVRQLLDPADRERLLTREPLLRHSLDPTEAYNGIHDPAADFR